MLAIYIVSLVMSCGLVGLFGKTVMTDWGFVPNFQAGVLITIAAAGAFAALQAAFMAFIRVLLPSRSSDVYMAESVSQATALFLAPYLVGFAPPLPGPLARVEVLVYFGLFVGLHLFFKLATFYASLQSRSSGRIRGVAWFAVAVVSIVGSLAAGVQWFKTADRARPVVSGEAAWVPVAGQYSVARAMPEGATYRQDIEAGDNHTLAFHWALESAPESNPIERLYITVEMQGAEQKVYQTSTRVGHTRWGEVRVPREFIPNALRSVGVRWTSKSEPNWQRLLRMRPIVYASGLDASLSRVLMSGPNVHEARVGTRDLNFIVLVVDGLAANHVSMFRYAREVTPAMDRLGYNSLSYPNSHAKGGDSIESLHALLAYPRPDDPGLVEGLSARAYATAGFVEGAGPPGGGLERGFEIYDTGYSPWLGDGEAESGSSVTLEKARRWIEAHGSRKFFLFVRLQELERFRDSVSYQGMYPEAGGRQRDVDRFDNALAHLDPRIGALLKYVRDRDIRNNTCIVVTSSYGHEFSLGPGGRLLDSKTDRVPLILHVPGGRKAILPKRVSLDDVAATMAHLADVPLADARGGKNLVQ